MGREWFTLPELRAAGLDERLLRALAGVFDKARRDVSRVRAGCSLVECEAEFHISVLPHYPRSLVEDFYDLTDPIRARILKLGICRPVAGAA